MVVGRTSTNFRRKWVTFASFGQKLAGVGQVS